MAHTKISSPFISFVDSEFEELEFSSSSNVLFTSSLCFSILSSTDKERIRSKKYKYVMHFIYNKDNSKAKI